VAGLLRGVNAVQVALTAVLVRGLRAGQTLAAGTNDDDVWLWSLDVDSAIQRVCASTGSSLTREQWDQYVSAELPYDPPCAHPGRYGLLVH
jgi:hypothetical protein